ncbi:MAG: hypothetical protein BGO16_09010 [Nitrobacter sp. 62-23]|nr:MAG: hypothetical protein BGO16_09010 [Nitrobacter sp. 62-23]
MVSNVFMAVLPDSDRSRDSGRLVLTRIDTLSRVARAAMHATTTACISLITVCASSLALKLIPGVEPDHSGDR